MVTSLKSLSNRKRRRLPSRRSKRRLTKRQESKSLILLSSQTTMMMTVVSIVMLRVVVARCSVRMTRYAQEVTVANKNQSPAAAALMPKMPVRMICLMTMKMAAASFEHVSVYSNFSHRCTRSFPFANCSNITQASCKFFNNNDSRYISSKRTH